MYGVCKLGYADENQQFWVQRLNEQSPLAKLGIYSKTSGTAIGMDRQLGDGFYIAALAAPNLSLSSTVTGFSVSGDVYLLSAGWKGARHFAKAQVVYGWHDSCTIMPNQVMVDQLLSASEPSAVRVGIETPHGAVVSTLLSCGFQVYSIIPLQSNRLRDRHSPAGAKDDRRDAWVLADGLRTDLRAFRQLSPQE